MPSSPGTKRWWWIVVALVGAAFVVWRYCRPEPVAVRNDCQQDHLVIYTSDHDSVIGADLPLVGPIADLPEFHDCQRLVIPAGTAGAATVPSTDSLAFGPLVAIWAANELDSSFADPDSLIGKAVPVAVIYNFDAVHGYEPLGIRPGFNCLFLWNDGRWHARLVALGPKAPNATDPTKCLDPIDQTSRPIVGGTELEVRATAVPEPLKPSDIPPVARWDWEAKAPRQFIGIRCGNEWCDVGTPGFEPSRAAEGTSVAAQLLASIVPIPRAGIHQATPSEVLRTVAVKGWYDHQRLDLRSSTGQLSMAEASGIVFPQPALDAVPVEAYATTWIPTAYAVLEREYPGKYPLLAGVNRIDICHGTANDCAVPTSAQHCDGIDRDSPDGWWGRVIRATGEPYYYCIIRRTHDGEAIPVAAARWNWSEADAKTWSRCGNACCTGS